MYDPSRLPSPVGVLNPPLCATPRRRDWITRSGLTVDFQAYNTLRGLGVPVQLVMPSDRDDDPCGECPEIRGVQPVRSQCRIVFHSLAARWPYSEPVDVFHAPGRVAGVLAAGGRVLRIELPLIPLRTRSSLAA